MNWLIDQWGRAHRWSEVTSLYPNETRDGIVIETGDYRHVICETTQADSDLWLILERSEQDGNAYVCDIVRYLK